MEDNIKNPALADFFQQRFNYIAENKYPVALIPDPASRLVIHLIPDKFQEIFFDIKTLDTPENYFLPLGQSREIVLSDFNFDGIFFHPSEHEKQAYTQFFRDGRVETVAAVVQSNVMNGVKGNVISLLQLQLDVLSCLKKHLALMHRFAIPGPYALYFRFTEIENIKIHPRDISLCGFDGKGRNKPLALDNLIFPMYKLEHAQVDLNTFLLPFFDILWNCFGFQGRPPASECR